jgi:hypothetical protein
MADLNDSDPARARRNYLIPIGHFVLHGSDRFEVRSVRPGDGSADLIYHADGQCRPSGQWRLRPPGLLRPRRDGGFR